MANDSGMLMYDVLVKDQLPIPLYSFPHMVSSSSCSLIGQFVVGTDTSPTMGEGVCGLTLQWPCCSGGITLALDQRGHLKSMFISLNLFDLPVSIP